MKVTKEKVAENRDNVVKAASALFRERGFHGVNVPELMAGAGLTHGGFYRQFNSKEALLAEAAEVAFTEATELYEKMTAKPHGLTAWSRNYLTENHQYACPIVNLAENIGRQLPNVKKRFALGLRRFLGVSETKLGTDAWNKHTAAMAMIIGTLLMAKAVRQADDELANAIIHAGLKHFDEIKE